MSINSFSEKDFALVNVSHAYLCLPDININNSEILTTKAIFLDETTTKEGTIHEKKTLVLKQNIPVKINTINQEDLQNSTALKSYLDKKSVIIIDESKYFELIKKSETDKKLNDSPKKISSAQDIGLYTSENIQINGKVVLPTDKDDINSYEVPTGPLSLSETIETEASDKIFVKSLKNNLKKLRNKNEELYLPQDKDAEIKKDYFLLNSILGQRIVEVSKLWEIKTDLLISMFNSFGVISYPLDQNKDIATMNSLSYIKENDVREWFNSIDSEENYMSKIKLIKFRQGLDILLKKVDLNKPIPVSQKKDYELINEYKYMANQFKLLNTFNEKQLISKDTLYDKISVYKEDINEIIKRLNGTKEFVVFNKKTLEVDVGLTLSNFRAIKTNSQPRATEETFLVPIGFLPVLVNDKILFDKVI